jgi:hypothetical protein
MFCCFRRHPNQEALHSEIRNLQDDIQQLLQMNNDLADYSNDTIVRYTSVVHKNTHLESMVSAQKDDIIALTRIPFCQDKFTQTE